MTESQLVKMIVVLVPCIVFMTVAVIGAVHETIKKRNSTDLFKDEEALKLLAYMTEED